MEWTIQGNIVVSCIVCKVRSRPLYTLLTSYDRSYLDTYRSICPRHMRRRMPASSPHTQVPHDHFPMISPTPPHTRLVLPYSPRLDLSLRPSERLDLPSATGTAWSLGICHAHAESAIGGRRSRLRTAKSGSLTCGRPCAKDEGPATAWRGRLRLRSRSELEWLTR